VWGKPPNHKEHDMGTINSAASIRVPWNKGKLVGQKAPFKLKEIWAIRVRLQISSRGRELALFNLAVDSKLRACDLVQLRVRDVCHGQNMASRALILQQKTQRPVQFEITEPTRAAVSAWIKKSALKLPEDSHIASEKLTRYLRVPQARADKSAYLALAGYTLDNFTTLLTDLRAQILNKARLRSKRLPTSNFKKSGQPLVGPSGRSLRVRTIWLVVRPTQELGSNATDGSPAANARA